MNFLALLGSRKHQCIGPNEDEDVWSDGESDIDIQIKIVSFGVLAPSLHDDWCCSQETDPKEHHNAHNKGESENATI